MSFILGSVNRENEDNRNQKDNLKCSTAGKSPAMPANFVALTEIVNGAETTLSPTFDIDRSDLEFQRYFVIFAATDDSD